MLNKVVAINTVEPYGLRVTFSDGASGVHNCSGLVQRPAAIMQQLRDPAYFSTVFLEFGAPTWPNSYDMCPDWLRMEMEKAGELSKTMAAE